MKLIPLTKGFFAKVDDEDFERLSKFRWQVSRTNVTCTVIYAKRGEWVNGKMITRLMHRDIIGDGNGQEIDHADRDGLNNQKSNLRFVSPFQNCQNRRNRNHSSPYKGVSLKKTRGKYQAAITINKHRKSLGYFRDEKEAALAYDRAALLHFGQFALTNQQLGVL